MRTIDDVRTLVKDKGTDALDCSGRIVWLVLETEQYCDAQDFQSFVDIHKSNIGEVADAYEVIGASRIAGALRSIPESTNAEIGSAIRKAGELVRKRAGYSKDSLEAVLLESTIQPGLFSFVDRAGVNIALAIKYPGHLLKILLLVFVAHSLLMHLCDAVAHSQSSFFSFLSEIVAMVISHPFCFLPYSGFVSTFLFGSLCWSVLAACSQALTRRWWLIPLIAAIPKLLMLIILINSKLDI